MKKVTKKKSVVPTRAALSGARDKAFKPTKPLGKASTKMLGTLKREAPETLVAPKRTSFVTKRHYDEAVKKFRLYGNWASDR